MACCLQECWCFDEDDDPTVTPEGVEEQDCMLVDDYDLRYLHHMMTLLTEQDQQLINNGTTIYVHLARWLSICCHPISNRCYAASSQRHPECPV